MSVSKGTLSNLNVSETHFFYSYPSNFALQSVGVLIVQTWHLAEVFLPINFCLADTGNVLWRDCLGVSSGKLGLEFQTSPLCLIFHDV